MQNLFNLFSVYNRLRILISIILIIIILIFTNNFSYSHTKIQHKHNNEIYHKNNLLDNYLVNQVNNEDDDEDEDDNEDDEEEEQNTDDVSPINIEKFINFLYEIDVESLQLLAESIGIEYIAKKNKEALIAKIIELINENYSLVNELYSENNRFKMNLTFKDKEFEIESTYFFKKKVISDKKNYSQFIFFNCKVSFDEYVIKNDVLVINIYNEDKNSQKPSFEFMISGNIQLKIKRYTFCCEKIFIEPEAFYIIIYNAVAYLPELIPFLLVVKKIKILSIDEIIASDVELSGLINIEFPHYKIKFDTLWLYPDLENLTYESLFASHLSFQVGQSTLFYFPFLFHTTFSSGISIDIKYEYSMGFIIQTTSPFKLGDFSNILILDYYQKIGLYFSLEEEINLFNIININIAGAYDRAVEYIGKIKNHVGYFSNSVDINNDGISSETFNSFRYSFEVESPISLYYDNLIDNLIDNLLIGMDLKFFKISDPFFRTQFMDFPRNKSFILDGEIIYKDKTIGIYVPDVPGNSSKAMDIDMDIYLLIAGFKLGLYGDWQWSFKSRIGELNPYDVLNYYDIQLKSISFPNFLIGIDSSLSNNLIDDTMGLYFCLFNPEKNFNSLSDEIAGLNIKLPLEYKIRYHTITRTNYVEDDTEIKETEADITVTNAGEIEKKRRLDITSFSYNLPFGFSYSFLSFGIGMKYSLVYNFQKTYSELDIEANDIYKNDLEATNFHWNWDLSGYITFSFFKDFEYLSLEFGLDIAYSHEGVFDDFMYNLGFSEYEVGESYKINAGEVFKVNQIFINFFKSSIVFTGLNIPLRLNDDDYKYLGDTIEYINSSGEKVLILIDKEYLLEQKKSEYYNLVFTSKIFDYITFSLDYFEINRLDYQDYMEGGRDKVLQKFSYPSLFRGKGNKLITSFAYNQKVEKLLFNFILINNIKFDANLTHYFGQDGVKNDDLDINIETNFDITSLWTLSISYAIENKNLWRYKFFNYTHPDNDKPIGFFEDILDSLCFWDIEKLHKTRWKMKNLSFSLIHDLAEWQMTFKLEISPRFIDGFIIFEPLFTLSIKLIDLPNLSGGIKGDGVINNFYYDRY